MVFDVESLTSQELIATRVTLENLQCTHKKFACVDCPSFEICTFVRKVTEQCMELLEKRAFS